jgi:hypothetical protein
MQLREPFQVRQSSMEHSYAISETNRKGFVITYCSRISNDLALSPQTPIESSDRSKAGFAWYGEKNARRHSVECVA